MSLSEAQRNKTRLIVDMFKHFSELPPQKIEEATIIVCKSETCNQLYAKCGGQQRGNAVHPYSFRIGNHLVINSTKAFLEYDKQNYFLTTCYLLKKVKKAKFIFLFTHAEMKAQPIKQIKQVFEIFASFFKKEICEQIGRSCGVVVMKMTDNHSKQTYLNVFGQSSLLQQGYLKAQRQKITVMVKQILKNKSLVYFENSQDQKQYNDGLKYLLDCIHYVELQGPQVELKENKIDFKIDPKNSKKFASLKIDNEWKELWQILWIKLETLITKKHQYLIDIKEISEVKDLESRIGNVEDLMLKYLEKYKIKNYLENMENKQLVVREVNGQADLNTLETNIEMLLTIIERYRGNQSNKELKDEFLKKKDEQITEFLKTLYLKNILISPILFYYFRSYFKFKQVFSTHNNEDHDLFTSDKPWFIFLETPEIYQKHIIFFSNNILGFLASRSKLKLNQLQLTPIIASLKKTIDAIHAFQHKDKFITNRVLSKLTKYLIQFRFKKISLQQHFQSHQFMLTEYVSFLEESAKTDLAPPEYIKHSILFIAQYFASHLHVDNKFIEHRFDVSLSLFTLILYDQICWPQIINLYETRLNIIPQLLPFHSQEDWEKAKANQKDIENYLSLLIQFGFFEKVRLVCYDLLAYAPDEDIKNMANRQLSKIIGKDALKLHQQFLLKIRNQSDLKVDPKLIKKIIKIAKK